MTRSYSIGFLLLNNHSGRGGLESVLSKVSKELKTRGHKTFLYTLHKPKFPFYDQSFSKFTTIPHYATFSKIPRFLKKLLEKKHIKRHLKDFQQEIINDNIDILIVLNITKQFLNHYEFLKQTKAKTNIPYLSWTHSSISDTKPQVIKKLKDKVYLFDGHLAISAAIARELKALYNQKNSYIIYNPVDPSHPVNREAGHFLYIGRIDDNKRVLSLINNMRKLTGDWRLEIFGTTGSPLEDQKFQETINSLQLDTKIIFHGWKDNPWQKIHKASLLLLNSKKEGLPLVIAEAIMRGIPVVSSDCPTGPNELIIPAINGWLYPVDKEEQGIKIIQDIIDQKISLPSSETVQDSLTHLHTENVIDKIEKILKKHISL